MSILLRRLCISILANSSSHASTWVWSSVIVSTSKIFELSGSELEPSLVLRPLVSELLAHGRGTMCILFPSIALEEGDSGKRMAEPSRWAEGSIVCLRLARISASSVEARTKRYGLSLGPALVWGRRGVDLRFAPVCEDIGKVGIKRPCVELVLEQGIGGVWGKDDGSSRFLRRGDFDFERGADDRD